MSTAVVTLSSEGAVLAERLRAGIPGATMYLHERVPGTWEAERFNSIRAITRRIFATHPRLVFIAPCGAVVRALSPCLGHKSSDPGVVVVDAGGRWAISLVGGHEGGANLLAVEVGNLLGAEPVVSTTTEALKNVIVGIGCRRGRSCESIVSAVQHALEEAGLRLSDVRLLGSADVKAGEPGLLAAARELGVPLRFIPSEEIRGLPRKFDRSPWVEQQVNLPAVAEPCALLAGRRTRLVLGKRSYDGVTVAIARESSMW